jgi:hypothetical protein
VSVMSLALARQACGVDYTVQDVFLQILLDGAENFVEKETGTYLSAAAVTEDVNGGGFALWPSRMPVNSVTSVTDNETGVAVSTDDWHNRKNGIYRDSGARWESGRVNRWEVVYNGGYTTLPYGLRAIILQLVVRGYHARGGKTASTAAGYDVEWGELLDSDMMMKLEVFKPARARIG